MPLNPRFYSFPALLALRAGKILNLYPWAVRVFFEKKFPPRVNGFLKE